MEQDGYTVISRGRVCLEMLQPDRAEEYDFQRQVASWPYQDGVNPSSSYPSR